MPQRTKLSVSKGLPVNTSTKSRAAKYTQRKGPKMKMALMPDKMRDKFRTPRCVGGNSPIKPEPLYPIVFLFHRNKSSFQIWSVYANRYFIVIFFSFCFYDLLGILLLQLAHNHNYKKRRLWLAALLCKELLHLNILNRCKIGIHRESIILNLVTVNC